MALRSKMKTAMLITVLPILLTAVPAQSIKDLSMLVKIREPATIKT